MGEDSNTQKDFSGFVDPQDLQQTLQEISDEKGDAPTPAAPAYSEEDMQDESDQSYDEGLDTGVEAAGDFTKINSDSIVEKQEDTRGKLAIIYIIATFIVFLVAMAIAVLDGLTRKVSIIDNLSTIIPLISGVFLGTLGFVIGYYFRKDDNN